MSLAREVLKYAKHPGRILPRLTSKVLGALSFFLAKAWVRTRGRGALRKGRRIFLYGAFGGRRFDDNSAAFFEYMVANHPEIDSCWVIRKDCFDGKIPGRPLPDRERVAFKDAFRGNVLALVADVFVYSHGRYDITDYPKSDTPCAFNVMLDHGFTALKKTSMVPLPTGRTVAAAALDLDLIAAGSVGEAKIHEREWGIPPEKIAVTGLARYDRLYSLAQARTAPPRNILYMPTWRQWNSRKVSLFGTEFFRQAKAFLADEALNECLARNGRTLQLYVHMWMREFFEDFKKGLSLENIEILDQGGRPPGSPCRQLPAGHGLFQRLLGFSLPGQARPLLPVRPRGIPGAYGFLHRPQEGPFRSGRGNSGRGLGLGAEIRRGMLFRASLPAPDGGDEKIRLCPPGRQKLRETGPGDPVTLARIGLKFNFSSTKGSPRNKIKCSHELSR